MKIFPNGVNLLGKIGSNNTGNRERYQIKWQVMRHWSATVKRETVLPLTNLLEGIKRWAFHWPTT